MSEGGRRNQIPFPSLSRRPGTQQVVDSGGRMLRTEIGLKTLRTQRTRQDSESKTMASASTGKQDSGGVESPENNDYSPLLKYGNLLIIISRPHVKNDSRLAFPGLFK